MRFGKTLASLVVAGATTIGANSIRADIDFQRIDLGSGAGYGEVMGDSIALATDKNRNITHALYQLDGKLYHSDSTDNFVNKTVISDSFAVYGNLSADVDSSGNVHAIFNSWSGTNSISPSGVYYLNTRDLNLVHLNAGNNGEDLSLRVDKNDKLYIGAQRVEPGYDMDIVLFNSTNYQTFNETVIHKPANQMDPALDIDSQGNVHLTYFDWSDGVGPPGPSGPSGLYKLRYRNSLDGYTSETTFSPADQSFDGDLRIDSNDNVWIAYKDSTESLPGEPFQSGLVWLTDKDSGWQRTKINDGLAYFNQDKRVGFEIDENDIKHVAWLESIYGEGSSTIFYANTSGVREVVDTQDYISSDIRISASSQDIFLLANGIPDWNQFGEAHSFLYENSIPEPSTALLVTGGLVGLLASRRKQREKTLNNV